MSDDALPTVPVNAFCHCGTGRRRPPIRLTRFFAKWALEALPSGRELGSFFCNGCGTTIWIYPIFFNMSAPSTAAAPKEALR